MIVTDKKYYMDKDLVHQLDLMCDRTSGKKKFDNVVLIDGNEGYGKTNLALGCIYYVACKLNRKFDLNNVFFDLDEMVEFALRTEKQVIQWDEAALGGLAAEWWKKNQLKFMKFLMIARKKQHFFFICIPRFYKLNDYLCIDRSIALIHVYARQNIHLGRWTYYGVNAKEELYNNWRSSKKKKYAEFYNLHGTFVEALPKILDEKEYDKKKDKSILSLKEENKITDEMSLKKRLCIKIMENLGEAGIKLKQRQFAKLFGVSVITIQHYAKEIKETNEQKPHNI